jgi:ABC-2 type transport system permease protein
VLLNQVGLAALDRPFKTIAQAFWDKRLETYRLAVHGIWANIVGRLVWQVAFATVLQLVALLILLLVGGLHIMAGVRLLGALLTILLLVGAHAGLGLAGASMFFLLEIKTGQDPITWVYRYLVMLVSGLYVPLAVLPDWLQGLGAALPQTYALTVVRALLLSGAGRDSPQVTTSLLWLALLTAGTLAIGVVLLDLALRRAERHGGIGVVV